MSLFSLLALTFGMVAAAAERIPRPAFALIAVSGKRASVRRIEKRQVVEERRSRLSRTGRIARPPLVRRLITPLRGTAAARAPGFGC
ncbi:MAG TPA: hypothetical protein VKB93_15910 [Thermoanaerobaculia bacterium]|nr:hypothetical protein [Thermoanaerobaculia bacterium]